MSRASDISDAAAAWLVRLEGQTTPEIWDAFQEWMDQNPRHRAEFIRLREAWIERRQAEDPAPDGRHDRCRPVGHDENQSEHH